MAETFYWHDYETFGSDPVRDRASQFAGIRTDLDFNIIGDPLTLYCQPARDMLPHPEACLITGITPQEAEAKGVPEAEFIARIHQELAAPQTCTVGYNSIRFDDEVTRHTLYRNFYDAYAREWQNGNSRWDLIDLVRICRALRPEGIEWPDHKDGSPSFKLEDITKANGLSHEAAHDALSDVQATIGLAKLIKEKQPKLFDYIFQLRNKRKVLELLNVVEKKPVLHTSAMFSADRFCTTLVMPLAMHPSNKNGVITYDLSVDPQALLELSADEIRQRLFTATADLPEGVERIALKTIHINRCPVLATTKLLDDKIAERIKLPLAAARNHYKTLLNAPGLSEKLREVFLNSDLPKQTDPDYMLYSGGFFNTNDKQVMSQIRSSSAEELREHSFHFEDERLDEMLFRYRARNYPDSLTDEEQGLWEEYRFERLTSSEGGANISMDKFHQLIEEKRAEADVSERDKAILNSLLQYGDELLV
jgi:exodeoxyribonuclease-1